MEAPHLFLLGDDGGGAAAPSRYRMIAPASSPPYPSHTLCKVLDIVVSSQLRLRRCHLPIHASPARAYPPSIPYSQAGGSQLLSIGSVANPLSHFGTSYSSTSARAALIVSPFDRWHVGVVPHAPYPQLLDASVQSLYPSSSASRTLRPRRSRATP